VQNPGQIYVQINIARHAGQNSMPLVGEVSMKINTMRWGWSRCAKQNHSPSTRRAKGLIATRSYFLPFCRDDCISNRCLSNRYGR
jgi:hypothetical protein